MQSNLFIDPVISLMLFLMSSCKEDAVCSSRIATALKIPLI